MNHQSWIGFTDERFGYGAMLKGFLSNTPATVKPDTKASVQVYMGVPMAWKGWWEGQHRACFTMWETTELPSSFKRYLPLFDQILVPCEHNVELFSKHHSNVAHVPLGVDTSFWVPQPRQVSDKFRFHAAGSLWRRKGLDALVTAFNKLNLADAELHIKAAPHAADVPKTSLGENVFLHRNWMGLPEQRDWFNLADCFVAPSRGEGFGLIPLQAISLGIPTICSTSSGQAQFANLATHPIGYKKVKADSVGLWDEPNMTELMGAMEDVYRNRNRWMKQAREQAVNAERFSWDNAVTKLLDAIPEGVRLSKTVWRDAMVTCTVRAKTNIRCHIGGRDYRMAAGGTYEIPDGAYQVLYDSGDVEMV